MKKIFALILALTVCQFIFAKSKADFKMSQDVFSKGNVVVDATIGIANFSGYGAGAPFHISGEYCILDNLINKNNGCIGVGAVLGIGGFSRVPDVNCKASVFRTQLKFVSNFHYQFVPKLDTYVGLSAGVVLNGYKYLEDRTLVDKHSKFNFAWGAQLGARYYFKPNWAALFEFGHGMTIASAGISYKF